MNRDRNSEIDEQVSEFDYPEQDGKSNLMSGLSPQVQVHRTNSTDQYPS